MKKIKCPRCFQTKTEKAFKQGALHYEWCKECREKFDRARRKQIEQKILAELASLGLIRKRDA
ncbi:MAG: hypothetical protein ACK4XY_01450 [Chloroherpetonaceae bacterium]